MSTIAAISTAPGNAGIGIIRLSGDDCFKILQKIFKPKNTSHMHKKPLKTVLTNVSCVISSLISTERSA